MVSMVITFAVITAVLEALLLLKFFKLETLKKPWVATSIHVVAAGTNLIVHWGTIVGTMTAITAALVSFAVIPSTIWLKSFIHEYRRPHRETCR